MAHKQGKISKKNYESRHPNTRNLGVAKIHMSVSQFLTHPSGEGGRKGGEGGGCGKLVGSERRGEVRGTLSRGSESSRRRSGGLGGGRRVQGRIHSQVDK